MRFFAAERDLETGKTEVVEYVTPDHPGKSAQAWLEDVDAFYREKRRKERQPPRRMRRILIRTNGEDVARALFAQEPEG